MDYALETYGCALNQSDSHIISGLMQEMGYTLSEDAELRIINTCTVKTPTEHKIIRRLEALSGDGCKVIVAGCLPAADQSIVDRFPRFSFIGTNVSDIRDAVRTVEAGARFVKIDVGSDKFSAPRASDSQFIDIVPIAEGCLGGCSYCITKRARGKLRSYDADSIVERIEDGVLRGVREFWLTAQDTGAYGADIGCSLPELLHSVCDVDGGFKIRVGMMNPDHALSFLDELMTAYGNDKIYKFAHIPVQSGSDNVLRDMGRKYSAEDFIGLTSRIRESIPDITLSTDVICGYPNETDRDFKLTLSLIRQVRPAVLNVSRFWPRPGTRAASLDQHPGRVTKERSRRMSRLFSNIGLEENRRWVGWGGGALVSEANPDGTYTARNHAYKPIILEPAENMLGREVKVRITDCTYYDLRGVIV
ncbi:MAG: tRNA (N(6)-L-threonylcarbamoyladenosine(37)-C(2))-methylthiotransferase [Candidatus Altiarchaeota archaeon]